MSTEQKCPDCDGRGVTESRKALEHLVHLILIAGEDSAAEKGRFVHPWLKNAGLTGVGSTLHEVTSRLSNRPLNTILGYDAIDRWRATKTIVNAAGLDESWGTCETCKGEGFLEESE